MAACNEAGFAIGGAVGPLPDATTAGLAVGAAAGATILGEGANAWPLAASSAAAGANPVKIRTAAPAQARPFDVFSLSDI
jgi:hypothetical protein